MSGTRRSKRQGILDPSAEIEAMRVCRDAMVRIRTACPINSPEYKAAYEVMRSIDDLVELMTGRRETLWGRSHGSDSLS